VLPCPLCQRPVEPPQGALGAYPFCSNRCKQVDLGRWLSEDSVPAGPEPPPVDMLAEDFGGFVLPSAADAMAFEGLGFEGPEPAAFDPFLEEGEWSAEGWSGGADERWGAP